MSNPKKLAKVLVTFMLMVEANTKLIKKILEVLLL